MRGISSVASRNNPVKYTDPDGRNIFNRIVDFVFSPFTSLMLEPQNSGGSSRNLSNRSYYNQTFKSVVDQDNGWRNFFGMLGWAPGKAGVGATVITWLCPEKEETCELDWYDRSQFIAGAKKEIELVSPPIIVPLERRFFLPLK